MEYKILFEDSRFKLEDKVNLYLRNGWELCDGPFIREVVGSITWYQAIIRP